MKKIVTMLGFIPHVLLVLTYGWHGVGNFMMGQEYTTIITALGFNDATNTMMLICVGLLDSTVAILLIFKDKLLPKLRWIWLLMYASLYPIIPRIMQWMGGDGFAWIEVLTFATVALLAAYNLHAYKANREVAMN